MLFEQEGYIDKQINSILKCVKNNVKISLFVPVA
jgi:hypothetical protein